MPDDRPHTCKKQRKKKLDSVKTFVYVHSWNGFVTTPRNKFKQNGTVHSYEIIPGYIAKTENKDWVRLSLNTSIGFVTTAFKTMLRKNAIPRKHFNWI